MPWQPEFDGGRSGRAIGAAVALGLLRGAAGGGWAENEFVDGIAAVEVEDVGVEED